MNVIKYYLTTIFSLLAVLPMIWGQSVRNVKAVQEKNLIAITYDLTEKSDISISVSYHTEKEKKDTLISPQFLTGDIGKRLKPGKGKKVVWRIWDQFSDKEEFIKSNISFIVNSKPCMRFFLTANGGYSLDSGMNIGLTGGQVGYVGWYLKTTMTPSFPRRTSFTCDRNGQIDGVVPGYTGLQNISKLYAQAGMTIRLGCPLYLTAGTGYGGRFCDWEMMDGRWVRNASQSYQGMTVDLGLMANIRNIAISLGVTILEWTYDFSFGIGYVF